MLPKPTPEIIQKLYNPLPYLSNEEVKAYQRKEIRFALRCILASIIMLVLTFIATGIFKGSPGSRVIRGGEELFLAWHLFAFGLAPYGVFRLLFKRRFIAKRARADLVHSYDGLYVYENQRKAAEWQAFQKQARKIGIPLLILMILVIAIIIFLQVNALQAAK